YTYLAMSLSTYIYTLSLHDALPIYGWQTLQMPWALSYDRVSPELAAEWPQFPILPGHSCPRVSPPLKFGNPQGILGAGRRPRFGDRKSTRLNSSHQIISYAVFCLKK